MSKYVLERVNLTPSSIGAFVLAISCFGVLLRWLFKTSKRLDLPTFYVKSDVVATLEQAHKEVYSWFCPDTRKQSTNYI